VPRAITDRPLVFPLAGRRSYPSGRSATVATLTRAVTPLGPRPLVPGIGARLRDSRIETLHGGFELAIRSLGEGLVQWQAVREARQGEGQGTAGSCRALQFVGAEIELHAGQTGFPCFLFCQGSRGFIVVMRCQC
jgi:hypothetical protein